MKKSIFFLILLTFCFFSLPNSTYAREKITRSVYPSVTFFYSSHCKACLEVKEEFFSLIKEKYKGKLLWRELNIDQNLDNLTILHSLALRFNKEGGMTPSVLVGDAFLVGKKEIEGKLEKAIEAALSKEASAFSFPKVGIAEVFKKISFFTVAVSGLIDGINPCAFAVIVFFVSFLGVYGYRKREIAYVGSVYCAAVFLTYLLIGLGFFNFLYAIKHFYLLIKLFYYFVALFCFLLCGLSLYDYFKFKKGGKTDELILQLPQFLKKKINIVIGARLREKEQRSLFSLIFSAFIVGFLVSLLEAVCTGQIYLPTIVFILKNTNLKLKAFFYLLFYNFMFIFPLIVVFALTLVGFSSKTFNAFLKRNIGKIKLSLAIVFLALGILIFYLK